MPIEAESMYERFGALKLPLRADDISDSGLASLDPSRDLLLDLFASAINSELGEVYAKVRLEVANRETLGDLPVSDTLPDEPSQANMQQRKGLFPMLALHRAGTAQYEQYTLEITRIVQPWSLHYILGPLDLIDGRKLKDICSAIPKIVAMVIRRRGHASFQGGALQFFGEESPSQPSPLSSVRIVSHEGPGQAVFGESATIYWAVEMKLESTETSGYVEEAQGTDLDGATMSVSVGGGEGLLPDMIIAKTDPEG